MSMTRTTIVLMTLVLVMFVATFCAVSYSRLVNQDATTTEDANSRQRARLRASRRGFKTVAVPQSKPPSADFHHAPPSPPHVPSKRESDAPRSEESNPVRKLVRTKSERHLARSPDNEEKDRSQPSTTDRKREWRKLGKYFRHQLKPSQRDALKQTFSAVTEALRARKVTFWMDGGTLLGSYRHHGLIRWDDDMDLLVSGSQRHRARLAIKSLRPTFRLRVEKATNSSLQLAWRIFAVNGSVRLEGKRHRFPSVDLLFYAENASHVWIEPQNLWWNMIWPKRVVFPLHLRPLDNVWVPSPCDTERYLMSEFRSKVLDVCVSPTTAHRTGIGQRRTAVPCRLIPGLPYVNRTRDDKGATVETLMVASKVLRQETFRQKCGERRKKLTRKLLR